MEKKCQIGAVGDPRGEALDVLLVGQCVLDSKGGGPRVSLQEEVVDVEPERLAHLLDLVDEPVDLAHGGSSGWSADVCVLLVRWEGESRSIDWGSADCVSVRLTDLEYRVIPGVGQLREARAHKVPGDLAVPGDDDLSFVDWDLGSLEDLG